MIRLPAALLALVAGVTVAAAQPATRPAATAEVVVLTSFPKELFEAYKQAFEQNHAVTYLRETRARPEADVFRVSAVDAFQTLKADGLLEGSPCRGRPSRACRPGSAASRFTTPTAPTGASRSRAKGSCGTRGISRSTSCPPRARGRISPTRATSATSSSRPRHADALARDRRR